MQNIDSDLIRGNIDTIILKTMLGGDMYGLDIIKEVENKSNGTYELKQPTLYSCLKRLENQGLISSYWLDSDIGGKRHYYKLTEKGHDELSKKQEEWSRSKFIIDNLLGDFDSETYRLVKKDDYDKIIEGKTFDYSEQNSEAEKDQSQAENNLAQPQSTIPPYFARDEELENFGYFNTADDDFVSGDEDVIDSESNYSDFDSFASKKPESDVVYFNSDKTSENEDENLNLNSMENHDQTEQENNILSRLRSQSDEEINTYYGDKQSYINQVNISEPKKVIQQNLLDDSNFSQSDIVDSSVDEFEKNIEQLNTFQELGSGSKNDQNEIEQNDDEWKFNEDFNDDADIDEKNDYSDYSDIDFYNDEDEDDLKFASKKSEFETENDQLDDEYAIDFNQKDDETFNAYDSSLFGESQEDDSEHSNFLDELGELGNGYHNDFDALSDEKNNQIKNFEQTQVSANEQTQVTGKEFDAEIAENFPETQKIQEKQEETLTSSPDLSANDDDNWKNIYGSEPGEQFTSFTSYNYGDDEPTQTFFNNMTANQTTFDDIIYKNSFSSGENKTFTPSNNESYKQKLQNLSTYTKNSTENSEGLKKAKDIGTLKSEFEKQGITVTQYKKDVLDDSERNYILINKFNLIKSLILMFGFVFILSALYLILASTSFKNNTGFSFVCFLYGFIPFAVYAIYHLVLYILNPYKKIPAKYSPGIMLFISAIITVQLLLITYCVNLQIGFYSFSQAGYNHLNWIIPLIISFAPLVSTGLHCALFYSRNFNI